MEEAVKAKTDAEIDRMTKHLCAKDEELAVVLRGHLFAEELIVRILEKEVDSPEYVKAARLSFEQRLCMARALVGRRVPAWVWNALKLANELRNHLAHRLEHTNRDHRIRDFNATVRNGWAAHTKSKSDPSDGLEMTYLLMCMPLMVELHTKRLTTEEFAREVTQRIESVIEELTRNGMQRPVVPASLLTGSRTA